MKVDEHSRHPLNSLGYRGAPRRVRSHEHTISGHNLECEYVHKGPVKEPGMSLQFRLHETSSLLRGQGISYGKPWRRHLRDSSHIPAGAAPLNAVFLSVLSQFPTSNSRSFRSGQTDGAMLANHSHFSREIPHLPTSSLNDGRCCLCDLARALPLRPEIAVWKREVDATGPREGLRGSERLAWEGGS